MALLGCKINKENQFIDFRLITQSRKNDAFILLCHQPQGTEFSALFALVNQDRLMHLSTTKKFIDCIRSIATVLIINSPIRDMVTR